MKQYWVKHISVATVDNPSFEAGKLSVHYIGKGTRVFSKPDNWNGWSQKRWAEKYIADDKAWKEHWHENHPKFWNDHYKIIVIE